MNLGKLLTMTALAALLTQATLAAKATKRPSDASGNLDVQSGEEAIQTVVNEKDLIHPLGIIVATVHDFQDRNISLPKTAKEAGGRLQVLAVERDSHASNLGLHPGDVLMEINGIYVPKGKTAEQVLKDRVLPQIDWSKALEATVLRGGYAMILKAERPAAVASTASPNKDES